MQVTWQECDIKAGIRLGRRISPNGDHVILGQMCDEGMRYCVTLENNLLSPTMTKANMATYLNEHGYKPAVLLTL